MNGTPAARAEPAGLRRAARSGPRLRRWVSPQWQIWAGKKENAQEKEARQPGACALGLALFCSLCILAGNLWTTGAEIQTAPFRKAYLAISRDLGLNYRTASDEDLELYLHSGADEIRSAMEILEENKLNIFREK